MSHLSGNLNKLILAICSGSEHGPDMANNIDPDQTAPKRSSLMMVNVICHISLVPIFRVITEGDMTSFQWKF